MADHRYVLLVENLAGRAGDGSSLQVERPPSRLILLIELFKLAHLEVPLVNYITRNTHLMISHITLQSLRYHILFELTHELHVVEGVDLELDQLVVEAAFAYLGRLGEVGLHRELLAWGLAVGVCATFAHLQELTVRH